MLFPIAFPRCPWLAASALPWAEAGRAGIGALMARRVLAAKANICAAAAWMPEAIVGAKANWFAASLTASGCRLTR